MIKGETVHSGAEHPGTPLEVLNTPAGYYLGFRDTDGAPYSRETGYMTREDAEVALAEIRGGRGKQHFRTNEYTGGCNDGKL